MMNPQSSTSRQSGIRHRGPLVLLVEENDDVRDALARALAAAGFMVLEAGDAEAAIQKTLQFGPRAVLLNLSEAGLDGLRLVRSLRAEDRMQELGILALLPDGSSGVEPLAVAAGVDVFVRMPVEPQALVAELFRVFAMHEGVVDRQAH